MVTEEVKEQLVEASAVTKKAYTTYRREAEAEEHQAAADGSPVPAADKSQEEGEMSVTITIMQPILRLMQLLCENHNRDLQVSYCVLRIPCYGLTGAGLTFLARVLNFSHQTHLYRNETVENRLQLQNFLTQSCMCWSGFTMRSVLVFGNG